MNERLVWRRREGIGGAAVAAVAAVAWLVLAGPVSAKIDLVTLPERDHIQITIYNSEDLTLVREMRELTFAQGANQIQFSWANTLIDPTSLQLFFPENSENFEILDITYPANTQNVLIWNVEAQEAGPGRIEILYFCSGLTWSADYVGKANPEETAMGLEGYVRVTNGSGEDFVNAQTRLLVGTINLVDRIADLARRGIIPAEGAEVMRRKAGRAILADFAAAPAAPAMAMEEAEIKEVVKQAVSEYQLYTIEGTEDILDGWSKRLRSFGAEDVKFEVAYEYDERKYGPQVIQFYKLKNDAEHNLGKDPLPEGVYRVLREDGQGGLVWEGQHTGKYIPIGEKLDINLGADGLITLEPRQMEFRRVNIDFDQYKNVRGWDQIEDWKIEIRNSNPQAVPIKVVRYFEGDWEIDPKTDGATKFRKRDQYSVEFETRVEGLSTKALEYTLTTHHGTRSNQK
jgi:hypothetical protein